MYHKRYICKQGSGKEDDIKKSNFDCNLCGLRVITKEDLVQHLDIKYSTKKFFGDATIKAENNNYEIKLNKRSKKKNQCPVVRDVNISIQVKRRLICTSNFITFVPR